MYLKHKMPNRPVVENLNLKILVLKLDNQCFAYPKNHKSRRKNKRSKPDIGKHQSEIAVRNSEY